MARSPSREKGGESETRLPFAVDHARLERAPGKPWAMIEERGPSVFKVVVGVVRGPRQAQLNGYRLRALRGHVEQQALRRHQSRNAAPIGDRASV